MYPFTEGAKFNKLQLRFCSTNVSGECQVIISQSLKKLQAEVGIDLGTSRLKSTVQNH